jgi:hypothetical protein
MKAASGACVVRALVGAASGACVARALSLTAVCAALPREQAAASVSKTVPTAMAFRTDGLPNINRSGFDASFMVETSTAPGYVTVAVRGHDLLENGDFYR